MAIRLVSVAAGRVRPGGAAGLPGILPPPYRHRSPIITTARPHTVQRSDDQYVRRVFGRHTSAVGPPVRTSLLCQFTSPRRRVVFVTTARAASVCKRRAERTLRAAFVRTCVRLETNHNRKKETRTTAEPFCSSPHATVNHHPDYVS